MRGVFKKNKQSFKEFEIINIMSEIFYQRRDANLIDNLVIDVKNLYNTFPINNKINPKPNYVDFLNRPIKKIYRNSLIPKRFRIFLWGILRQANIDLSWFTEFKKYWSQILGARPLWDIYNMFFLKDVYRIKFQYNQLPDTVDPYIHLEAWQRPEVIYQLLFLVCREAFSNNFYILRLLKKKKKKFNSILEFGCGTAPITTSLFEFFRLPKNIKIFISDIQTLAFHYAAFKFRHCLNVIPILLIPDNDFLLNMNEKVDVIFCMTVFEHLNKPLETIKIFHSTLENDGLLFFDYIISTGGGLDTHISARERDSVLDFINKNFDIVHGKILKDRNMSLTIAKKR